MHSGVSIQRDRRHMHGFGFVPHPPTVVNCTEQICKMICSHDERKGGKSYSFIVKNKKNLSRKLEKKHKESNKGNVTLNILRDRCSYLKKKLCFQTAVFILFNFFILTGNLNLLDFATSY